MKNPNIEQNTKICARIFFLLAALCCILLCGESAYAEDTTWQKDYKYTLDDNNHYIKLKKYNGKAASLTVPAEATVGGEEYTTFIESDLGTYMWSGDSNLTSLKFEPGIELGNDLSGLFMECNKLKTLDVSGFDTSSVKDMRNMFCGCESLTSLDVRGFDTANVKDMSCMFCRCKSLTSLDVSGFDTENVRDMSSMFDSCSGLRTLNVSSFVTSQVTSMGGMFQYCTQLKSLDVSKFDTSSVSYMAWMFEECSELTTLDVSNFDTSEVYNMGFMFDRCSKLKTLDVSHFNTSAVVTMEYMFSGCSKLRSLDVSNFNTDKLIDMTCMFAGCSSLTSLDLHSFDCSNGMVAESIISGCDSLKTIRTPLNLTYDNILPGTFYSESKVNYDCLPKKSSVSILLRKGRVPIYIVPKKGNTHLYPGGKTKLMVKGARDYNIRWKVNRKKVATIDNKGQYGLLTMKKDSKGKSVTVTATLKKGKTTLVKSKKFYCHRLPGEVEKVSINEKTKTLKMGKERKLKATVHYKNNKAYGGSTAVNWSCNKYGEIKRRESRSCIVVGTKKGLLIVTARSVQNKKKSKAIRIRVK